MSAKKIVFYTILFEIDENLPRHILPNIRRRTIMMMMMCVKWKPLLGTTKYKFIYLYGYSYYYLQRLLYDINHIFLNGNQRHWQHLTHIWSSISSYCIGVIRSYFGFYWHASFKIYIFFVQLGTKKFVIIMI